MVTALMQAFVFYRNVLNSSTSNSQKVSAKECSYFKVAQKITFFTNPSFLMIEGLIWRNEFQVVGCVSTIR